MTAQTILVVADDPGLARDIVGHWQMERTVPGFTLMTSAVWSPGGSAEFDLAIVGEQGAEHDRLFPLLRGLDAMSSPCIFVAATAAAMQRARAEFPRMIVVRQQPDGDWLHSVVQLGVEVLRRMDAISRLRRTESSAGQQSHHAALGRYMVEIRHNFNNALTSVLGNAELLMLEPAELPAEMREQLDTIHSMALRLHEMMQRFSSLDAEMQFAERERQPGRKDGSQTYVAGSLGS